MGLLVADIPHSAALVGTGSDVLGFDSELSTDRGGGEADAALVADDVLSADDSEKWCERARLRRCHDARVVPG